MRRTSPAQLPLLDLPAELPAPRTAGKRRDDGSRRRAAAAMTARHCNALLAAIDRVLDQQQGRAQQLARLFEAAENAHTGPDREAEAHGRSA